VDVDNAIVGRDNETWVATIIRAAENEALERAAAVAEKEQVYGNRQIAAAIRALKVEP
jgi:hypothetical protein